MNQNKNLTVDSSTARLTHDGSSQDLGVLTDNMTLAAAAKFSNCNRQTVPNLSYRHQQTGSENDRPRPGSKSATAMEYNRYIRLQHLLGRLPRITSTAPQTTGRHNVCTSEQKVSRQLLVTNLRAKRRICRPHLTSIQRRKRRLRCKGSSSI